jgi:hypothetical protein
MSIEREFNKMIAYLLISFTSVERFSMLAGISKLVDWLCKKIAGGGSPRNTSDEIWKGVEWKRFSTAPGQKASGGCCLSN